MKASNKFKNLTLTDLCLYLYNPLNNTHSTQPWKSSEFISTTKVCQSDSLHKSLIDILCCFFVLYISLIEFKFKIRKTFFQVFLKTIIKFQELWKIIKNINFLFVF